MLVILVVCVFFKGKRLMTKSEIKEVLVPIVMSPNSSMSTDRQRYLTKSEKSFFYFILYLSDLFVRIFGKDSVRYYLTEEKVIK